MRLLPPPILAGFALIAFLCLATTDRVLADEKVLPRPDHVIVVIEENHGYERIIRSPDAPFINELASEGTLFTHSFALTHPSQPNYLALFSGSLQGVDGNSCPNRFDTPNLASALLAAGLTFAGYSEDLPQTGSTLCKAGLYARKHNPWVNWQDGSSHGVPARTNLPWTDFPSDYSTLPTISLVVPNTINDMHDGKDPDRIRIGDRWLKAHLGSYIDWMWTHNSLLILTWDEDDGREDNRIPTIFAGPMVRSGTSAQRISHYNVLRTLEDFYGLVHSGQAATAEAIHGIWNQDGGEPNR